MWGQMQQQTENCEEVWNWNTLKKVHAGRKVKLIENNSKMTKKIILESYSVNRHVVPKLYQNKYIFCTLSVS